MVGHVVRMPDERCPKVMLNFIIPRILEAIPKKTSTRYKRLEDQCKTCFMAIVLGEKQPWKQAKDIQKRRPTPVTGEQIDKKRMIR